MVTFDEHAAAVSAAAAQRSGDHSRTLRRVLIALVGVLALLAAGLVGRVTAGPAYPSDTSADAGFSRDMQVHHAQAVEMAMIVRDRTDDEGIRLLAYDIALTQQEQIGEMHGWLVLWGLTQTSDEPAMEWMGGSGSGGHQHGGSPGMDSAGADLPLMPGMATAADMKRLTTLSGAEAEVLFLQLMIAHHRGGVDMAEAGASLAGTSEVRDLAAGMAKIQQTEIDLMNGILRDRGAPEA